MCNYSTFVMASNDSENITPTPSDSRDSSLIEQRGGEPAAQDSVSDGGASATPDDQPVTATEKLQPKDSSLVPMQLFYKGRAPANVAPPSDVQLRDKLADGPEMTDEPADLETMMNGALPPSLLADDGDTDDTTPAMMSTPTLDSLSHGDLQQMEGLPVSLTVPSFIVQTNSTVNTNFIFQEMGKSQSG